MSSIPVNTHLIWRLYVGVSRAFALPGRLWQRRTHTIERLRRGDTEITVSSDRWGAPTIQASSRSDAYWALGYLLARERLFQIDLLRRMVAGRLAEIFGPFALDSDTRQRTLGFTQVASNVVKHLPSDQVEVLQAYTDGINYYRKRHPHRPLECLLLRYTPEDWQVRDCILIGLYIFQDLTSKTETYKRATSIMGHTLPEDVFAFFTSDEDAYPQVLLGGTDGYRPFPSIPTDALKELLKQPIPVTSHPRSDDIEQVKGSNGWVVAPERTSDGRTILANDMHLALSVPGIWYKATLQYEGLMLTGVTVPGLPGIMLGSNGHVSWGFTNTCGDFLDLVELELDPERPDHYKSPDGWEAFQCRQEQIVIRGKPSAEITIRSTIWGPVALRPLLGKPIALHWTALDPSAMNCHILNMDRATSLKEAIAIMHQFGAPPMNAMLADAGGHIGWTICGKIPVRRGGDGFISQSWADGRYGWDGYVPPAAMPCIIDPPEGFLVTANNRITGREYPYPIGFNCASGYRAHYLYQQLQKLYNATEEDMFHLQLDSSCHFYRFYQQLAEELLTEDVLAANPYLREIKREVTTWDGQAEIESRGIALLTHLRERLAERVLEAYFASCMQADETFMYGWNSMERPLRQLLATRDPALFPFASTYPDWETFILSTLEDCAKQLQQKYHLKQLQALTWGAVHRTRIGHPLGFAIKLLGPWLNMPSRPLSGTPFSVRASAPGYGASVRLVVSPEHEKEGLYNLPGGQSGRPFSRHYRDQYRPWLEGMALPL